MDWRYKALLQSAISFLPAGHRLNYVFQRQVTRSLPVDEAKFVKIVAIAERHVQLLKRHGRRPLETATFYEFGAGWDLIVPLSLYALGVERQILVDIRRLSRPSLVNDTIDRLGALPATSALRRRPQRRLPAGPAFFVRLKEFYGIDYRAPCDARWTGLGDQCVDYITSTNTLEHVPAPDVLPILRECQRLLRRDGVMTSQIDYQDHYSYFDPKISAYNFLRYSEREWRKYSQSIHYQNRLRHPDYLRMIGEAGFQVFEQQLAEGTPADQAIIDQLPLDERFGQYDRRELAIRSAFLAVGKRPA